MERNDEASVVTARLRWRCRRGMRELDLLLEGYLNSRYRDAGPEARRAFARLVEMPDPLILSYLMGSAVCEEAELADVVRQIRATAVDCG